MALSIVILAAGQGKRMVSDLPKPLHPVGGKPMLVHVLETVADLGSEQLFVVYSDCLSDFEQSCAGFDVQFVRQEEQLGTGHAVHQVLPHITPGNQVLILFADVPLIELNLLETLVTKSHDNCVGLISTQLHDPTGFGRIVRDQNLQVVGIVEHKDASQLELAINEINTGIMLVPQAYLAKWLPKLTNENAQGEYYLTDIVALAVAEGVVVDGLVAKNSEAVLGVNDRRQLAKMERYYQRCLIDRLMDQGVTIADPMRFDCRGDVEVGQDITMDVGVILEGKNKIGSGCHIGPYVTLKNVTLGCNVRVEAFSVLEGAIVEDQASVGPFSRLRKGAHLMRQAKVGSYVEVKNTQLGEGAKASHLAYLGDAMIGSHVNIGAGTITCNYDGIHKHKSIIGNGAFIGANTSLVAPITVGSKATIAAGSTVSQDVPPAKLTIARSRQTIVETWTRPEIEKREPELVESE